MSDVENVDLGCEITHDHDHHGRNCECFRCRKPGHPIPKEIIFECGTGNGFTFATNGSTLSLTSPCTACRPKTVASVVLDTTCLCKPVTKIEFASNVHFVRRDHHESATVQLEFELVRVCDDGSESSICSWYYEITNERDNFAQTFSFIYCDCNSCPGCCTYFVRVNPIEIDNASVSVGNCHIAGFAKQTCNDKIRFR